MCSLLKFWEAQTTNVLLTGAPNKKKKCFNINTVYFMRYRKYLKVSKTMVSDVK